MLLGVVRPALRALAQPAALRPGDSTPFDAVVSDETPRSALLGSDSVQLPALVSAEQLRLEDARKLTRENPAAVANIVKAWMGAEAPA